MCALGGDARPALACCRDDSLTRPLEFTADVRERRTDGRRDLDHRLLQLGRNRAAELAFRARQDIRLAAGERERRAVDNLILFFDAEREAFDR